MFPDLIMPAEDFDQQFGACVNAMHQDDAQSLVFELARGELHVRGITALDLRTLTSLATRW